MNKRVLHRARVLLRAIKAPGFVANEEGIFLPEDFRPSGIFVHNVNGRDERRDANIVVTEGLNHTMDVVFHDGTKVHPWYIALFAGNVTPLAGWTAATFTALSTEYDDYDEATRQEFEEGAPAAGSLNNLSDKAAFTIGTGGATIYGAALLSASAKNAVTGTLWCATRFATARILAEDDVFNVGYTASAVSAS